MEDRGMKDVVYFYGIVPTGTAPPPRNLRGVAGAPVDLVPVAGALAVISRVPEVDYGAERVEARLEDLAWVGAQGMDHERVVLWFVDHADILPARLLSLHSDDVALGAVLEPRREHLLGTLADLAGHREWNLKVAFDPDTLSANAASYSADLQRLDRERADAPPGRRYLLERKRTDLLRVETGTVARRLADELLDRLAAHARDVRRLPLPTDAAAGNVVLSAALLVERNDDAALRATAETLEPEQRERGMIISFSGPWAPYRFTEDRVEV
jgi:hypothetical protein